MNYFIPFSLLCAATIHAADQQSNSTKVYVCIKNTAPFKNKANPNQKVWDVAQEIAKKHNLTVTGLYYYQRNGQIQGNPIACQSPVAVAPNTPLATSHFSEAQSSYLLT